MSLPEKFHLVTAVWGEEYISTYLDICLPNQLSSGNLPVFFDQRGSLYKIYTSEKDAETIRNNRHFKEIERSMETAITTLSGLYVPSDHSSQNEHAQALFSMNRCHRLAITEANVEDAAIVFLTPDLIFSQGSFANLLKLADSGYRAILTQTIRVIKESMAPELITKFVDGNGYLQIPARSLVSLSLSNLHHLSEKYFVDSKFFAQTPRNLFWRVEDEGFLGRCSHFHPLMIHPTRKTVLPLLANDHDFYINSVSDFDDFYIIEDSDIVTACDLTIGSKQAELIERRKFKELTFATRMADYLSDTEFGFFKTKVRVHSRDISEKWRAVEKASSKVIARMLAAGRILRQHRIKFPGIHNRSFKEVKRVVIFGSGRPAGLMADFVEDLGWEVACVIDSDENRPTHTDIPIKPLSALETEVYDLIIVASEARKNKVFTTLDLKGLQYGRDYIHFNDIFCLEKKATGYVYARIRLDASTAPLVKQKNRYRVEITDSAGRSVNSGYLWDISPGGFVAHMPFDPESQLKTHASYSATIYPGTTGKDGQPIKAKAKFNRMIYDTEQLLRFRRYMFSFTVVEKDNRGRLHEFIGKLEELEKR